MSFCLPPSPSKVRPLRIINSTAPIRTVTIITNVILQEYWIMADGAILGLQNVFNIATSPNCEVQIQVFPRSYSPQQVTIYAENYNDEYSFDLSAPWVKHPLLEATVNCVKIPDEYCLVIHIFSEAPAGAHTGTSAAVTVALIGALDAVVNKENNRLSTYHIAKLAQAVETEKLKQQCGIQDQLASAFGGCNFIDMHKYPEATVEPLVGKELNGLNSIWWELERRLCLIYLGNSDMSSDIHKLVIQELEGSGPENPKLEALRKTAKLSRDAILSGDLMELGKAMIMNTEAQKQLHHELVSPAAIQCFEIAAKYNAIGWKVNGAGGKVGGSLTILCSPNPAEKRAIIREIEALNPNFKHIPVSISKTGVRVWEAMF